MCSYGAIKLRVYVSFQITKLHVYILEIINAETQNHANYNRHKTHCDLVMKLRILQYIYFLINGVFVRL